MEWGNYILISYKNVCCVPIQAGAVLDTGIQRNMRQTQLRENFYLLKDKHVSIRCYQTDFMTGRQGFKCGYKRKNTHVLFRKQARGNTCIVFNNRCSLADKVKKGLQDS